MQRTIFITIFLASLLLGVTAADAGVIARPANNLGLVGYWSFNEGSGTTAGDSSGKRNTGTLVSGPTWTTGKLGKALSFNGSSQYVTAGSSTSMNISGAITVSAWIYPTDVTCASYCDIVANFNAAGTIAQYELTINNFQLIEFDAGDGLTYLIDAGTTALTPNQWYHIVATRDAANTASQIYINGVADVVNRNFTISGIPTSAYGNTAIGRSGDLNGQYFPGTIDDVRIFNRELTATEVLALYKSGSSVSGASSATLGTEALRRGLVGHWTMDGVDVTDKVYDKTGNGGDGYFNGGATSSAKSIGKLGQALRFNGSTHFVRLASDTELDNLNNLTITAWVKPDVGADAGVFFAKASNGAGGAVGPDWWWDASGNRFWFGRGFTVTSGFWNSEAAITPGVWQFIAVTYSPANTSNEPTFYVNGVQIGTNLSQAAVGSAVDDSADSVAIGTYGADSSPANFFEGLMDDMRVYDRQLSFGEIQQLYNLGAQKVGASSAISTGGINTGLVGHWTFDGSDFTTSIVDKSGNSNNAYVVNAATSSAKIIGKMGQAIKLDGVNDYVNLGTNSSLEVTAPYTLAAWVNARDLSTPYTVVTTDQDPVFLSGANMQMTPTGFGVGYNDGIFDWRYKDAAVTIPLNSWHHYVGVVRGPTDMDLYMDGVNVGGSYSGGASGYGYTAGSARIGDNSLGNPYFPASFDDVRVYNRALSAAEAKQLYNLGR